MSKIGKEANIMSIATWFKHWSAAVDRRKQGTQSRAVAFAAEHLEVRSLLSTSVLIVAGTELNISLNVRDNVSVSSSVVMVTLH